VQSVSAEADNTALLRFFGWQAAAGTAGPLRLYSKLYLSLSFGFAPKAKHRRVMCKVCGERLAPRPVKSTAVLDYFIRHQPPLLYRSQHS